MDLERMHAELYKGKYLTADEFLDDIRKIVHNAGVRVDEDPERLFRAQAMLTAAEVSIQDFDLPFRHECQRMAVREHQRRGEVRKAREKARSAEEAAASGSSYAPGTRRSARHNGLEPELSITDPLLLERRLKRQRSAEAAAESEDQDSGEIRNAKRSRVSSSEVDALAPSNSRVETPPRLHAVRFVDTNSPGELPPSIPDANDPLSEPLPSQRPSPPTGLSDLLNPVLPEEKPLAGPPLISLVPENSTDLVLAPTDGGEPQQYVDPAQVDTMTVDEKIHVMDTTPSAEQCAAPDAMSVDEAVADAAGIQVENAAPDVAVEEPMVIERTPTPLPDFHVNTEALEQLKEDFRDRTHVLNVEQLEQLRATCLGAVWRHRTEWDRTALLKELRDTVQEFVTEASFDDMDAGSP